MSVLKRLRQLMPAFKAPPTVCAEVAGAPAQQWAGRDASVRTVGRASPGAHGVRSDADPHVERREPAVPSPSEPPVVPSTAPQEVGPRQGGSARREGPRVAGGDLDGVPPAASAYPTTGGSDGEGTVGDPLPTLSVGETPRRARSAKRYRHQIRLNEDQERIARRLAEEARCCINTACTRILVDALRDRSP